MISFDVNLLVKTYKGKSKKLKIQFNKRI